MISPHKFIGGPGTPGLLIAKKHLFQNKVPAIPGGGTVAYVNPEEHRYLDDIEHREEGGTPAIIESIRAGLVFQLKEAVGVEVIQEYEHRFIRNAIKRWGENENILVLGNPDAWRLSIVSFVVSHQGKFLHHNFVVALLNDLFGIQSRGGCSCAGPYGHRLLGIDLEQSKAFEREIVRGCEGIKPGWVRINFNYFISEPVFNFILDTVDFVAEHGWKFLPYYRFEPNTGQWYHHKGLPEPYMRLDSVRYDSGKMEYCTRHATEPEWALQQYLVESQNWLEKVEKDFAGLALESLELNQDFESLRWFLLPEEVWAETREAAGTK